MDRSISSTFVGVVLIAPAIIIMRPSADVPVGALPKQYQFCQGAGIQRGMSPPDSSVRVSWDSMLNVGDSDWDCAVSQVGIPHLLFLTLCVCVCIHEILRNDCISKFSGQSP